MSQTSTFGSKARSNHDSSLFYNGEMYKNLKSQSKKLYNAESAIPDNILNSVICGDSSNMKELPDNSVHLMITSPPYNVGKEYDKDLSLQEYKNLLYNVLNETKRVLVDGGRICINIANLGRKPYIPLHSYIIEIMDKLGFLMRGEIIWNKGASASPSVAWGSYLSASNPVLRDVHEYILIFSKTDYKRNNKDKKSTISKEEFIEYTKSIWNFSTASAKKIGHPAPFPLELPNRLIKLYSFEGDVILDPFCGSGTTCIAAKNLGRNFVGYDISPEYVELSKNRLKTE